MTTRWFYSHVESRELKQKKQANNGDGWQTGLNTNNMKARPLNKYPGLSLLLPTCREWGNSQVVKQFCKCPSFSLPVCLPYPLNLSLSYQIKWGENGDQEQCRHQVQRKTWSKKKKSEKYTVSKTLWEVWLPVRRVKTQTFGGRCSEELYPASL